MKVLIISVHPDDETLGCGGTLLRHRDQGDEIDWLVITQGYPPKWGEDIQKVKAAEVEAVGKAYGISRLIKLGFPAARLDTVATDEIMGAIAGAIESSRPEIVYLVHEGDVNTDHASAFHAAMSVLKPFHMLRLGVRRILSYETLSSTEAAVQRAHRAFLPQVFVDIGKYIDRKCEIMNLFASEIHQDPMPRGAGALRALARLRGATIAVDYAEAFMVVREIIH